VIDDAKPYFRREQPGDGLIASLERIDEFLASPPSSSEFMWR
jgi:hypothetical protein